MSQGRALRVGIDVGGTFTDLTARESWSGAVVVAKLPSTPKQPHRAVLQALRALLARYRTSPAIEFVGHATTIATNALLGQLGLELPRIALVTTDGFRDVIEIGRQNRSEVYNLFVERPAPLVARSDRLLVRERIDHDGNVLLALDERSLEAVCAQLRERNVAAVAICLLHAYANDAHERRIAEAIATTVPGVRIARSSEVDPQYREYERFSTTVVNAALAPIVERYLEDLVRELRESGIQSPLYVMRSDGGMAAESKIRALPAAIVEGGPASGVIAALALSGRTGAQKLLSFDMGGTTAKAGAIVDGVAQVAGEFEAAGRTHSGRAVKGSGYPVRFPFVDLAEVSAGGGAIAWIDDAGSLRVGPISAGADPGPACYGRSGTPTVTDANVVLGRLNPEHLLGGEFAIDAARARRAIDPLSKALNLSPEATAAGIVTLVENAMAKVLRIVTVERGFDPRDFTLVAFGGGGPLHACALAEELHVQRILIPANPGLFSAQGLLQAQLHVIGVHSILRAAGAVDAQDVEAVFASDEDGARASLLAQGADPQTIRFRREYDARYRGQSFELTIAYDPSAGVVERRFHAAHRARYGYDAPGDVVEVVNARLTATAEVQGVPSFDSARPDCVIPSPSTSLGINFVEGRRAATKRRLWLDGAFVSAPVFARSNLADGDRIEGPAVVEAYDSTTYVAPRWRLAVQDDLLVLERTAS